MENSAETLTPDAAGGLSREETTLLARAREIADTVLEPNAQSVDQSGKPPADNLRALAEAGLVGVTTPREWGGSACSGAFQREYTEILTAACGTTWFVLTQHLGACGQFAGSENPRLRETYLREMASGRFWVGVGFGHLRRPDPPLKAEEVPGGWRLNGVAPWVTGWPLLGGVIFGAALPDGRHVYVYAPVEESDAMRSTPPLPLCAMNATATTEVRLTDYFAPQENFVRFSSREAMIRGDESGIAGSVAPPLGCARGALSVLRRAAAKRPDAAVMSRAADIFAQEIDECRANARHWAELPDKSVLEYKPNALRARASVITLAVRVAHAAVAASGGGANSLDHPAQRLFREAMFYTLTAQTTDIQAATLEYLETVPL